MTTNYDNLPEPPWWAKAIFGLIIIASVYALFYYQFILKINAI